MCGPDRIGTSASVEEGPDLGLMHCAEIGDAEISVHLRVTWPAD